MQESTGSSTASPSEQADAVNALMEEICDEIEDMVLVQDVQNMHRVVLP